MLPGTKFDTFFVGLWIAIIWIGVDQQVKWWVLSSLARGEVIELTPFFNVVLVFNRGISFGLLGTGVSPLSLSLLALAIVAGLFIWLWRAPNKLIAAALGSIIGGALGNVIDRFRAGMVTDYLVFHLAGWHWPAFNVADVGVVCGVGLLLLGCWKAYWRRIPVQLQ